MPRKVTLKNTRSIDIMAHIDAGKTTTIERILYYTGVNYKIGEVHDGTATMGRMAQEQERGVTITSAAITCYWKGSKDQFPQTHINIIDIPDRVGFVVEMERSLHVLDGPVTAMCVKSGIEPQLRTVWHQAGHYKVPHMTYINKMDIMDTDFYNVLGMVHDRLKCNTVSIQLPIGPEDTFKSIIDLVEIDADIYYNELGKDMRVEETPAGALESAQGHHTKFIDACTDIDDEIMKLVLEEEPILEDMVRRTLREGTIESLLVPAIYDTSYRNKGAQKLLDATVDSMSPPPDIPATKGMNPDTNEEDERPANDNTPFSALVSKTMTDPCIGRLSFFRMYSGKLATGSSILNSTKNQRERTGRILQVHASHRENIEEVFPDDIAAAVGLENVTTGDILRDDNHPIILESTEFLDSVICMAIEFKTRADQKKVGLALVKLTEEDPTFYARVDEETSQIIIAGMGELHLEIIVDRLLREFKVEASVGVPQTTYKKTIKESAEQDTKYVHQSGGKGQYGRVRIIVEPNEPGRGYKFLDEITGGVIPKEYIPAADTDIQGVMQAGVLTGYPVVDAKIRLTFDSYHEVDSPEMTFKIIGSMASKEACHKADAILLEPMMKVSVIVPDEYLGNVIGDLTGRHGMIQDQKNRPGATQADTLVPLASMPGYVTDLRSSTQGRDQYSMESHNCVEILRSVVEKTIAGRDRKDD